MLGKFARLRIGVVIVVALFSVFALVLGRMYMYPYGSVIRQRWPPVTTGSEIQAALPMDAWYRNHSRQFIAHHYLNFLTNARTFLHMYSESISFSRESLTIIPRLSIGISSPLYFFRP